MKYSLTKPQLVSETLEPNQPQSSCSVPKTDSDSPAQDSSVLPASCTSKWTQEAIKRHLEERERRQAVCDAEVKRMKEKGDNLWRQQRYGEAANAYGEIIDAYGLKSAVITNLVACYLKLYAFPQAITKADDGLALNPKNIKLRYRRGQARKALQKHHDAITDFKTVLTLDPNCKEARQELAELERITGGAPRPLADTYMDLRDPRLPLLNQRTYPDEEIESESEDFFHEGNTLPCRRYNRGTCTDGLDCEYSHAPDFNSQRDKLGRNVCTYYLLRLCKLNEDDCPYLHDKTYLPDGWWNDPNAVENGYESLTEWDLRPEDLEHSFNPWIATLGNPPAYPHYRRLNPNPPSEKYRRTHPFSQYKKASQRKTTSKLPKNPFVAVVALEAPLSSQDCLDNLGIIEKAVPVEIIRSPQILAQRLDIDDLAGVFLADGALQRKEHTELLSKLVQYVKDGGTVVLGGTFSNQLKPFEMDEFFEKTWRLRWRYDGRTSKIFKRNPGAPFIRNNPTIMDTLPMNGGVQLKKVSWGHCGYIASYEDLQFSKFGSLKSPAVIAKIQKGNLGFIGDGSWSEWHGYLVLAMLGLFDTDILDITAAPRLSAKSRKVRQDFPDHGKGDTSKRATTSQASQLSVARSQPFGSSKTISDIQGEEPIPNKTFLIIATFEHTKAFKASNAQMLSETQDFPIEILMGLSDQRIIDLLSSADLAGVFVPYADIILPNHSALAKKLVEYTKARGTIVFGGYFGALAPLDKISPFFAKWGQKWKAEGYRTTEMIANPTNKVVLQTRAFRVEGPLSRSSNRMALHLSGVPSEAAVLMHAEDVLKPTVTTSHILTSVGKGQLGYVGDLESHEMSREHWVTVLSMLGA